MEVFNIGTGRGLSVLELINAFEKATGVKLNYQIVGRRAGDIEKVWANPELAYFTFCMEMAVEAS